MSLNQIYKKHKHWINQVKKFGIHDYAEDLVQEAYIKVHGKEINEAYFYFTLHTMAMDLHRKKVIKVPISSNDESHINYEVEEAYNFSQIKSRYDKIDTEKILVQLHELMNEWHWYDRMLFIVWIESGKSIRQFSMDVNIGFMSVYQTIRKCKNLIKQWQRENKNLED